MSLRFKGWVRGAMEPCRGELSQLLFPLFVNIFLELGQDKADAFYSKHAKVIIVEFIRTIKKQSREYRIGNMTNR